MPHVARADQFSKLRGTGILPVTENTDKMPVPQQAVLPNLNN